jgi:DNA-binding IclR family transcriptional regulator
MARRGAATQNDDEKDNGGKSPRSQTLVRGLQIMEAIADGPRTINAIAAATGLTYSTVYRIVSVLVERRYVVAVTAREYGLGPRMIELGFMAHAQTDLVRVARPWLERLTDETGDTVHLARLESGEVSYLDKLPGTRPVQISSRIGGRKPAISTGVGKALLLDETEADLRRLFHRDYALMNTPSTETDWMAAMLEYQSQGVTYDLGEDESSIRCVAAPIRGPNGKIVAAVSVSSTVEYMPPSRMESLRPLVRQTAAHITAELGGRPSDDNA